MRLCVFSDVHGNIRYLETARAAWAGQGIDRYVFLGDAVGYFPDGEAVIQVLQALNALCLLGNHDAMLLGSLPLPPSEEKDTVYQIAAAREWIRPETLNFMRSWPEVVEETIDGQRVRFVHGTPAHPLTGYAYEDNPPADSFGEAGLDFLFMGQTHRPWLRQTAHTTVVNIGSIGLPRDNGRSPSYAILDTIEKKASIERLTADPSPILKAPGNIHPAVLQVLQRE